MTALIVVAHPDDEILGCGGTMARLVAQDVRVAVCFMSGDVAARTNHPGQDKLLRDMRSALKTVGVDECIVGDFPNIAFNTVAHLELVQFIESAIVKFAATDIYTHHPHDLNDDHRHTSAACQAASRMFQRNDKAPRLRSLSYLEILSSTDWAFPGPAAGFSANSYVDISETLETKINALAEYENVMRAHPHPRSVESLRSLALLRGSESRYAYAEAFECVYRDES